MKPGDLVRIKRASIGIPKGTLGLITGYSARTPSVVPWTLFDVQLLISNATQIWIRRYYAADMETIGESR
jgi:hypothetical protein